MEELLNMKLHETIEIFNGKFVITRVPGGWIYDRQEPTVNIANPVFVPFCVDATLIQNHKLKTKKT